MGTYNIQEFTSNECLNQLLFVNDLYVGSDKIQGHSVVHKFGHNLLVNEDWETIWSAGGLYSFIDTPTVLKISSTDVDDDDGDTGARTVLIEGLDSNYDELSETVTLNGRTAVNTTGTYKRVHRMIVQTVGSSGYNEGIIYAGTGTVSSGVPANKYASIPATYNQSMMAIYTIPNNKTGYLTSFYAQPDGEKEFQIRLRMQDSNGISRIKNQLHAYQNQAMFNYRPYYKIEEKTDISIDFHDSSGNDASVGGGFSLILIDNN